MYDKTKLLELFEKMDSIHLNIDDLQELIEYFTESLENNFMIDKLKENLKNLIISKEILNILEN